jgi:glycosyltransferase involved in cell wall biosynthesis
VKILVISQVYWPDSSSVSQHLTDLAEDLVERGHDVQVISSRRGYENPSIRYEKEQVHKGVRVRRIWHTGFGKKSVIGRILDFLSFNSFMFFKLFGIRSREYDLLIGLTVPPLVSFIGILAARAKGMKFLYWAMDLQPELSIVTGYLKPGSIAADALSSLGNFIYKKADHVLALDTYMADHIVRRGAERSRIVVVPVWPVVEKMFEGARPENPFRREHGIGDKIVVMYSGNHSVVHTLDTVLDAALRLREDPRFLFLFIGGGVRKQEVTRFKGGHGLDNIRQLPYQDRDKIHFSLGAGDLHLVIMGEGCTGYTHPNKVYGAMFIGRPILYIGPRPSHITDILDRRPGNIQVEHGQSGRLVGELEAFANAGEEWWKRIGKENREYALSCFTREKLVGRIIEIIEGMPAENN